MPFVNVAELVAHARRHGYLVGSFTAHTAETMQAVVTAAEANRAPVIIGIETPSVTFLHHEINYTVAHSIAKRATVPVAIEAICRSMKAVDEVSTKGVSSVSLRLRKGESLGELPEAMPQEVWVESREDLDAVCRAPNLALIGVAADDNCGKNASFRVVRKQCEQLRLRTDRPLVLDGDMGWPSQALWRLVALGAAKINYDRLLPCVIAGAGGFSAKAREDHYWHGVERTFAALVAEITQCLKNINSTGRAADVLAFSETSSTRCEKVSALRAESLSSSNRNSVIPFAAPVRPLACSA